MAFNLVTAPTGGSPETVSDYNAQNNLLQALLYKYMQNTKHLTEWDTLNEPQMAVGTYVQHGGALFLGDSNTSIGEAPANGRVYIKVTRAGDALTFTFVNSAVGYTWNSVYCGFYHADGTQLLPYVLYKTASGYHKYTLIDSENPFDITALIIIHGVLSIGLWNMNTTVSVQISFDDIITQMDTDLSTQEMSEQFCINRVNIIKDDLTQIRDLTSGSADNGFYFDKSNNWISLYRETGAPLFDSINYDDAINRGHVHYTAKI